MGPGWFLLKATLFPLCNYCYVVIKDKQQTWPTKHTVFTEEIKNIAIFMTYIKQESFEYLKHM